MMKCKLILITALAAITTYSCGEAKSTNGETTAAPKPEQVKTEPKPGLAPLPEKLNNYYNEISGVLSGVKDSLSKLNHLLDTGVWKEHKTAMDASWKKLELNRLNKLSVWGAKELKASNQNCKTVFYPFSGPDFLTANAFYPKAEKMILLGLEPIGNLPAIDKFNNEDAKDYANDFRKSLSDIFEKSYFITQYMLRDFQKQKVNGLLPVLCFFIKKTHHEISDVKFLVRHNNDSISEEPYDTKEKYFGVKVTCEKDNVVKQIYYFRYDVSNKQFNDTCVFYRFINEHTPGSVTYIKSASYLLHANFMSNMKKLILRNSNYILEDDTGIPYDDIEKTKNFDIKLFGKYEKPIKNFPYLRMQTGIVKAFETDSANIPDLPFHLGYHWQSKKDLLIYAIKKQAKK